MGKVRTFSVVVGDKKCNAHCPFCVSRMTGFCEVARTKRNGANINLVNFHSAARLAQIGEATTVLITGKGEPLLNPDEIEKYLELLKKYRFSFTELQTNGLEIGWAIEKGSHTTEFQAWKNRLKKWRKLGLNTIALSVVHTEDEFNAKIYHKNYPKLAATIAFLRELGFTVRLCVMMLKDFIDTPEKACGVIDWCREHKAKQLTMRPIFRPEGKTENDNVAKYVDEHGLTTEQAKTINDVIAKLGTPVMRLDFGATIYDVRGQNVCLTDCLTIPPGFDEIRTLIFYSSGLLTYAWQFPGAILLEGNESDEE